MRLDCEDDMLAPVYRGHASSMDSRASKRRADAYIGSTAYSPSVAPSTCAHRLISGVPHRNVDTTYGYPVVHRPSMGEHVTQRRVGLRTATDPARVAAQRVANVVGLITDTFSPAIT